MAVSLHILWTCAFWIVWYVSLLRSGQSSAFPFLDLDVLVRGIVLNTSCFFLNFFIIQTMYNLER